ncbi:hypothetical protein Q5P01_016352 [Channa striata]|uniref:Uncharacterized protein n=1 Tax=Channa striata TaxID=64152 RepID=A0AA88MDV5_CHASR|nr:hypothetical protein Q5P01_016352 [Channa striata]
MKLPVSPKLQEQVCAVLLFTFSPAPPLSSVTSSSPLPDRGRQPISGLQDWDKVLFAGTFNSPLLALHLLPERFIVTPSASFYLSR